MFTSSFPVTLTFISFDLKFTSQFTNVIVRANLYIKYGLSTTFQFSVKRNERYVTYRQTDRQTNIAKTTRFLIFFYICRMSRGSFWSLFDVNRSFFHGDMRDNFFYIFFPSDLDL